MVEYIKYTAKLTKEQIRDIIDTDIESPVEPVVDDIDFDKKSEELTIKFHMQR